MRGESSSYHGGGGGYGDQGGYGGGGGGGYGGDHGGDAYRGDGEKEKKEKKDSGTGKMLAAGAGGLAVGAIGGAIIAHELSKLHFVLHLIHSTAQHNTSPPVISDPSLPIPDLMATR